MRVTIIDRAYIDRMWGKGYRSITEAIRTVEISDRCPECGGPRGTPRMAQQCEDGEWISVSRWDNPCGHVDMYRAVIKEAEATAKEPA